VHIVVTFIYLLYVSVTYCLFLHNAMNDVIM